MGLRGLLLAFGSKLKGLLRARRIKSVMFSGTPVLQSISIPDDAPSHFSLVYKNGLMLTLGNAGILDYQDRDFGHFIGGPGHSVAPDNREFLVHMHKIILKSLLRYITHPGLDTRQRERAAEAATKLWLASADRPVPSPDYSMTDDGSWSPGSARESAPIR
jgi:hypothetical protein